MIYGCNGLIYAFITFWAFVLFAIGAFQCSLTVSEGDNYRVYIGYWSREQTQLSIQANYDGISDKNVCVPWSSGEWFDGVWKFGKAVGVMGALLGGVLMLVSLYTICRDIPSNLFKLVLFPLHIVMVIFSLLLLVGLKSSICENEDCKFGPGMGVAIVAAIFWLISACLLLAIQRAAEDDGNPENERSAVQPFDDEDDEEPKMMLTNEPHNKQQPPDSTAMVPYNEDGTKSKKKSRGKNNQLALSNKV